MTYDIFQVYHQCTAEGKKYDYICGIGTAFNEETHTCDHWYNTACNRSWEVRDLTDEPVVRKSDLWCERKRPAWLLTAPRASDGGITLTLFNVSACARRHWYPEACAAVVGCSWIPFVRCAGVDLVVLGCVIYAVIQCCILTLDVAINVGS